MAVETLLPAPLEIIGMDCAWPGQEGLDAFERLIYTGEQSFAQPEALTGGDARKALESVALRALQDAGLAAAPAGRRIVALVAVPFVDGNADLPNWPWAEQVLDLSASANPLAAAIEQAGRLLNSGAADGVVFAAVAGLNGLPAGDIFAPEGASAMGFDRQVHGWRLGQGAAAVVLARPGQAAKPGYAIVRALAAAPANPGGGQAALPIPPALHDVRACCQAALQAADATPETVGYVEVFASGSDALDGAEIAGLAQAYRRPDPDLSAAIGSVQANLGYLGPAAGLFGLLRAALCLYQRVIPLVPGWTAPKLPALWKNSPFYAPSDSRPWFSPQAGAGRLAGLNVVGLAGSFAHLVLAEADPAGVHANRVLELGELQLVPLAGEDLAELLDLLGELRQTLLFSPDLHSIASDWNEAARSRPEARYAVSILGRTHEEIIREVDMALAALPAAFEKQGEWQTPLGSYFTAGPVGRSGEVALVYPGAFNSYPGVGKDLFRLFPWLHARVQDLTQDLGRVMRERLLYPRSLTAFGKEELAAQEARLLNDPRAMLTSGATLAVLFTRLLEEGFQVRPASAFGYSLGENSMMFASGAWLAGDDASQRLDHSEAFGRRLAGPQNALREYWGLPAQDAPDPDRPLWSNYLLMTSYENVQAAIAAEPDALRVYVTHINTPRQVVIGGDPHDCQRVIKTLRCSSLQAPFDYALHCQPIASELDELTHLHDYPIARQPHLRLYTAADYQPMPVEQAQAARKIAQMLCAPLDFPRLVQRVYADGARVFIEVGAGSNCARWVDESLKGRPHLALSLNRRGTDDYSSLVRTLARLFSHRVPMDLSILYQPAPQWMEPIDDRIKI